LALLCAAGVAGATGNDELPALPAPLPAPALPLNEAGLAWSGPEGLRYASADGDEVVKFGGRIMNDWAWHSDDTGSFVDGTEFRRARLYAAGTLYGNVDFKAQYDFAGGDADFKDVWIGLKDIGPGNLKVGHFKEPFSIEELTSSKYISFMERSLPDAFAPGRNTGAMVYDHVDDARMTWAVGVFRTANDTGNDTAGNDGEYSVTARVTAAPIYRDDGRSVLHLGAAYSVRAADGNSVSFAQRPEDHLAPKLVDTAGIAADGVDLLGVEAAWVRGPLSVQAELVQASVDATAGSDPDFQGYYVMGSWVLTGESRPYDPKSGTFGRLRPESNYGDEGKGALELTARLSSIDLSDAGVAGGELDDVTLGCNWYLNPHTRVMLNYVLGNLDDGGAGNDSDALLMRFQIDF